MPDDHLLLRPDPPPEPQEPRPHPTKVAFDKFSLAISAAALVAAAFAAWFTYRQANIAEAALNFARTSAEEQSKVVDRSLRAAERSAAAAEVSNTHARRSADLASAHLESTVRFFHTDERARVGFFAVMRKTEFAIGKKLKFRAELKNTGKTQALRLHGRAWLSVGPRFVPDYKGGRDVDAQIESQTDVAPGVSKYSDLSLNVDEALLRAINAGKMHIFLYGKVSYMDIFDPKTIHWTYWCSVFPPREGGVDSTELDVCDTHNHST
jgi:hypothetical protein